MTTIEQLEILIQNSEEVQKLAEIEWKHMVPRNLGKTDSSTELPPSDWIVFRQKYENWYRSCIVYMTKNKISGLTDFKQLYEGDISDSNTIKIALLKGFSMEHYLGFSDRFENQIAILKASRKELDLFSKDEIINSQSEPPTLLFVDLQRLKELRNIHSSKFDLTKLICLCEELNKCYSTNCIFAIAMLERAILDHVPPIFGFNNFEEVANNYAGRSFKNSMKNLQNSLRNIADSHLHGSIRTKEILPSINQVFFASDLDVLLSEIVRLLK